MNKYRIFHMKQFQLDNVFRNLVIFNISLNEWIIMALALVY